MTIRVHIERLVLDGVHVAPAHRLPLQAAIESELTRLLAERGLAGGVAAGGATACMSGGTVQLVPNNPERAGRQIAESVYRSIGNPRRQ